jgi:AcrR family transcriptional regulator
MSQVRPARGTRPANRRELILSAAADLFYTRGYANVGMNDIAEAVAVGPSALYRHFPSKQKLLEAVVNDSLDASALVLDAMPHERYAIARSIATDAIQHRRAGVLWRREARHIPEVDAALRSRAREFIGQISSLLAEGRPDLGLAERTLLAHCLVGAANSVSFHNLQLPEKKFIDILADILRVIVDSPIPAPARVPRDTGQTALHTVSKREALLAGAGELFARHGYANVSMEQIGAHAGLTAASVYTYFPHKDEILELTLMRTTEWLRIDLTRVLAAAPGPTEALLRLLYSYCEFVFDYPEWVHLLISEVVHLGDPARSRLREAQTDYIADWSQLVSLLDPDALPIEINIRVHATLSMMNDVAMSGYPRRYSNVQPTLTSIGMAVLALSPQARSGGCSAIASPTCPCECAAAEVRQPPPRPARAP